jgi:rubredoxin
MGITTVSPRFYDSPVNRKCPNCNSNEGVRIILYGMPSEEPDPAIYTIGGCCISDEMPKFECINCGWKGFKRKKKVTNSIFLT